MKLNGPGKYDAAATAARTLAGPRAGVVLLVFDGDHGPGLSVQASADVLITLPQVLRETARLIELQLTES